MFDHHHHHHQDYNNNGWISSSSSESSWNRYEDKLFEGALLLVPEDIPDRWHRIACRVPNKSPDDVRDHYEALLQDLFEIDSGRVQLPNYSDDDDVGDVEVRWESEFWGVNHRLSSGSRSKMKEKERKRGSPWTEDEHRLFLLGLEQYGKGDWRSISRSTVVTRSPTQVASHAQKYFIRQNSRKKERKRASIHDITTTTNTMTIPPSRNYPAEEGPSGYQNYRFPM